MIGFKNVLDMLASLFIGNPLVGLRLRLASTDDEGVVIMVESTPSEDEVEKKSEKSEDKDARKDL